MGVHDAAVLPRRARVYSALRTAHLERFRTMTPAAVLYRRRRYDFDEELAAALPDVRLLGRAATFGHLLRTSYDVVELNEPLMQNQWLDLAQQIVAIRLRSLLDRRRTLIGAYCIDLTDPAQLLVQRWHLPAPVARWWSRRVLRWLVGAMDRLAFGTEGARDLLARYVPESALASRSRVFPALSAPCTCEEDAQREPGTVLFLGALIDRKGIEELMAAWEVLPSDAGLRLEIIGKGELEDQVRAWVSARDDAELVVDPPRSRIHAALRRAHVLALLSQPWGVWREQVGLPIVEGLAHGCEIVTTDQTGLAEWLRRHGHRVVPVDATPEQVAEAIRAAAASARPAEAVCADLPDTDARWQADRWLLGEPLRR